MVIGCGGVWRKGDEVVLEGVGVLWDVVNR